MSAVERIKKDKKKSRPKSMPVMGSPDETRENDNNNNEEEVSETADELETKLDVSGDDKGSKKKKKGSRRHTKSKSKKSSEDGGDDGTTKDGDDELFEDWVSAEEAKSYVSLPGEWRQQKITVMGAVKSLITKLKVGQDMTKMSLPAVFFHPYSLLEMGAFRYARTFDHLVQANFEEVSAEERLLKVARWFLTLIEAEKVEKKPFNPTLGETHVAFIETERWGRTVFRAEQVSHHPPISAVSVRNEKTGVEVVGSVTFGVRFTGNSAAVSTSGRLLVKLPATNSRYVITKGLPDLCIRNVILGTRRIMWGGPIEIESLQGDNLRAKLEFKENSSLRTWSYTNVVSGTIMDGDQKRMTIKGDVGGKIEHTIKDHYGQLSSKELLVDCSQLSKPLLRYPAESKRDPMDTLFVWKEVCEHIIVDDQAGADTAKTVVEEAQREKRRNGEQEKYKPRWFVFNEELDLYDSTFYGSS